LVGRNPLKRLDRAVDAGLETVFRVQGGDVAEEYDFRLIIGCLDPTEDESWWAVREIKLPCVPTRDLLITWPEDDIESWYDSKKGTLSWGPRDRDVQEVELRYPTRITWNAKDSRFELVGLVECSRKKPLGTTRLLREELKKAGWKPMEDVGPEKYGAAPGWFSFVSDLPVYLRGLVDEARKQKG
jgi:hypothetical protein